MFALQVCGWESGRDKPGLLEANDANYCYFVLNAWAVLTLWQKSVHFEFSQPFLDIDTPVVPV